MFSIPKRFRHFNGLLRNRSSERKKNPRSPSRPLQIESLEQRQLLAVTAAYVDDYLSVPPFPRNVGGDWQNTNTEKGVVVVTIDSTDDIQDVFLRVRNGNYQFATDVSFSSPFFTIPSTATSSYVLQTTDPDLSADPPTGPSFGTFTSSFQTILVQGSGLRDGIDAPSFTVVGGSNDVTKTLVVSLLEDDGDPLSNSLISIGAPVNVAASTASGVIGHQVAIPANARRVGPNVMEAGQVYLEAETIAVNAAVTSQNDVSFWAEIGAENRLFDDVPEGIAIRQAVQGDGIFYASADAVGMTIYAGGSLSGIGAPATSSASSFTLDLRDTSAVLSGIVNAAEQSYWLEPSFGGVGVAEARTITTKSPSTGSQSGRLLGDDLVIYLANVSATAPAAEEPRDGSVDIATGMDRIRITSATTTLSTALDYDISVSNNRSLVLDAVMASQGDMSFTAETGTVELAAAIATVGGFSLQSATDLEVDSEIQTSSSITLESTSGDVVVQAALVTQEAATELGDISIKAAGNVRLESLVQAEYDGIEIIASGGSISSVSPTDPTSRLLGTNATLTAATGISVGTRVNDITATVLQAGDILIHDDSDEREDPSVEPPLGSVVLNSLTTTDGDITVTAIQDIDAIRLVAEGEGDVSLTSSEGSIFLDTVAATGDAVILTAPGWADEDGFYDPLTGVIDGDELSLTADEVDWTARQLPDATLYRNIPVISARLLAGGVDNNIVFTADGTTTLKNIVAEDGKVSVTSAFGSIVAGQVEGIFGDTATNADVTLTASRGDITLTAFELRDGTTASGVRSLEGSVTLDAGRSILDDGDTSTIGIISDSIELTAASNNISGAVGSESGRVSFRGANPAIETNVFVAGGGFIQPSEVFVEGHSSTLLTAAASTIVDAITTGSISDLTASSVSVSDLFGTINIGAGRDLIVGSALVGPGFFLEGSQVNLAADRFILNEGGNPNQTVIEADALSLTAASLDGQFIATNLDSIRTLSASATSSTGQVSLDFDRVDPLILDGIDTVSGAVSITNDGFGAGSLLIGPSGITAGTSGVGGSVYLSSADSIGLPDNPEDQGTITTTGLVAFNAENEIVAKTAAGILAATSQASGITIDQTGDVRLSNLVTNDANGYVTIDVSGSVLPGSGTVTTETATLNVTGSLWALTDITTLSASAETGDITITELNGLEVGLDGIQALAGEASLRVVRGALVGSGKMIEAQSVVAEVMEAGNDIDILTATPTVAASTKDGEIKIRNNQSLDIGPSGISAGPSLGGSNVTLSTTAGSIRRAFGGGPIRGNALELTAPGAIDVATKVNSLATIRNDAGGIVIAQSDKAVTVEDVVAGGGGITITNNHDISLLVVEAIQPRQDVVIEASGVNKSISLTTESVRAPDGLVSLTATGGIDGTDGSSGAVTVADVITSEVTLNASGDVTATVQADRWDAFATGTEPSTAAPSKLNLAVLTSGPAFIGTGYDNASSTYASGDNSLTVLDATDPDNVGIDIVVASTPESAAGTVALNTRGTVYFAVSTSSPRGDGSLSWAIEEAQTIAGTVPGTATSVSTGASFATTVRAPIRLANPIVIESPMVIDGTERIDLRTGTFTTGRYVDIDGARVPTGDSGFQLLAGSDNSVIRGLAFTKFDLRSPAIEVRGAVGTPVENIAIESNLFGVTSTGRVHGNGIGLLATNSDGLLVQENVFGMSRDSGISLGEGAQNSTVSNNLIGTDLRGRNLGNLIGLDLNGAGSGNLIGQDGSPNQFDFNAIGLRVIDTAATAAAPTVLKANQFQRNGTGIAVDGNSEHVSIEANTVLLGMATNGERGDGIVVRGSASSVTIGGEVDSLGHIPGRNYIGTNAANQLGLGNAGSGIRLASPGANIEVLHNVVFENNSSGDVLSGGVTLEGTADTTLLRGNFIAANGNAGIFATAAAQAIVHSNDIRSNEGDGVTVQDGSSLTIGAGAAESNPATIRAVANVIHSNSGYGIRVRSAYTSEDGLDAYSAAYAEFAGNSLASNDLGSAINENTVRPTISSATITTPNAYSGGLRVTLTGLLTGQVVDVYAGDNNGSRSYLGRVVATGTTAVFVMSRQEQEAVGVQNEIFVGGVLTASVTTPGSPGQTSTYATPALIKRS